MEFLNKGPSAGKNKCSAKADVNQPAMLLGKPQDTTALVGDRVLLKATYLGHPEPFVRWTRAGHELKNDEKTSITSNDGLSCLLLQNITADDSGKYDVLVENRFGTDSNFASVSVEGPPDSPSGKPCVSFSMDTVTVAWSSSPYDGGKTVTGFLVEYSVVGSEIWTTVTKNCHSLSFIIRGLQPEARYIFRVSALNVHGCSKPSQESDVIHLKNNSDKCSFEPRLVTIKAGIEFNSGFEVLEEIGKGRFGVVHKVVDKWSRQKLAAKFIKCRTVKDREKVQDEIDIMNLLRHSKLLQLAEAFETHKNMIMVTEYISGGELFERVVADDFTLTEKDCILFMRQICEGVAYMHSQNVVHLDLKPENIMCHTRTSHDIKIIDFGLAQKIYPNSPVRVLFGTPEFIPPEIINYEPIGIESDMWSLGVICYVLLSGLSPFMGDNDAATFANITRADYDFEDEAFDTVSQSARDFISALVLKNKEDRLLAEECLKHIWLDPKSHKQTVVLSTDKLKKFIIRRKWQKTGNAIRALGRMATLSASRRNSANSTPNTPRSSISAPRMLSLNKQDVPTSEENAILIGNNTMVIGYTTSDEITKVDETRAFIVRSDSGISERLSCSTLEHRFENKFANNEEAKLNEVEEELNFVSNRTIVLQQSDESKQKTNNLHKIEELDQLSEVNEQHISLKLGISNDNLTKRVVPSSWESPNLIDSLKRLPIYPLMSVAKTIQKFDNVEETPNKTANSSKPQIQNRIYQNSLTSTELYPKEVNSLISTVDNVKCKSSWPSLKKTQSFLSKEQNNKHFVFNQNENRVYNNTSINDDTSFKLANTKSQMLKQKDKPKSASFQKAATFWNSPKT